MTGLQDLVLPSVPTCANPVWHLFVVRHPRRDALQQRLEEAGIGTLIHYPIPPHLSGAYASGPWGRGTFPVTEELASTVLSLPMGPHVSSSQGDAVVAAVMEACKVV
jgi:dTDP-4-amino-4,6-dideoxygalactose transaminase